MRNDSIFKALEIVQNCIILSALVDKNIHTRFNYTRTFDEEQNEDDKVTKKNQQIEKFLKCLLIFFCY